MFKKLKEKKGFTLVELIVVLVILAILAALLIPALTKYIDKAKEKSITAETRQAVMAAQTLVDEKWADDQNATITVKEDGTITYDAVKDLAEVKGAISAVEIKDGKITSFTSGRRSSGSGACKIGAVGAPGNWTGMLWQEWYFFRRFPGGRRR